MRVHERPFVAQRYLTAQEEIKDVFEILCCREEFLLLHLLS